MRRIWYYLMPAAMYAWFARKHCERFWHSDGKIYVNPDNGILIRVVTHKDYARCQHPDCETERLDARCCTRLNCRREKDWQGKRLQD